MKRFLKSFVTISALSSVVIAPLVFSAGQASAAPKKGTDANYIGASVGGQVTNGGGNNDAANVGGGITARLVLKGPVSARTHVLYNDKTSTIVPQLSLDVPIARNTNAYVAGGYSFVQKNNTSSPLGNRNAPAVTVGLESQVNNNVIMYSNVTTGINAYKNSSTPAVNVGVGVGVKF